MFFSVLFGLRPGFDSMRMVDPRRPLFRGRFDCFSVSLTPQLGFAARYANRRCRVGFHAAVQSGRGIPGPGSGSLSAAG
jgi:hypothetical protein